MAFCITSAVMDELGVNQRQPDVDPEKMTRHPTPSRLDKTFIEKAKKRFLLGDRHMHHRPPECTQTTVKPNPAALYLKTVLVYSSLEQYPNMTCKCKDCGKGLSTHAWAEPMRY